MDYRQDARAELSAVPKQRSLEADADCVPSFRVIRDTRRAA
jgi:hypothetical protein